MGSIDDGDPNTTNIYLGNLPTKVLFVGFIVNLLDIYSVIYHNFL